MQHRGRYDTSHHDAPHRNSHFHHPHDASTTADNYCGTTASGHAAIDENIAESSRAKPHVEVCIDGERIGQLTPQMSQRFLPMIQHMKSRGLVTACWGEITGSAVAAKVRIDAIKANEAGLWI
ncbi:hypothetical protein [Nocardia niwae]|uniref:Uncharacterized protein n=1 Tax=Nocardia niwae TaxID=626084 RepID=A0ABV2X6U5_9NOCA